MKPFLIHKLIHLMNESFGSKTKFKEKILNELLEMKFNL